MAQASILRKYSVADASGKVDIICKNYANFPGIIDGFTEGIRYMIEQEKMYNRKAERGDLGVRVQTLGNCSDVTANEAINNVITRDAIISCDFSGGVLEGVNRGEQFQKDAFVLRNMREDYDLFNKQLAILGHDEFRIFLGYLNGEKKIMDIAEEEGILYESAAQRVRRAKMKIKLQMVGYLEGIA